jgi:hypothetical protein
MSTPTTTSPEPPTPTTTPHPGAPPPNPAPATPAPTATPTSTGSAGRPDSAGSAGTPESGGSTRTAYRWRWVVLATVLVAEIMDLVDATIVNIAAPSIRAELGGSESAMQWMLAGYTLAFAIGLISFGRLGDLVGRRRLFLIGAVGFTVASAVCGFATSP